MTEAAPEIEQNNNSWTPFSLFCFFSTIGSALIATISSFTGIDRSYQVMIYYASIICVLFLQYTNINKSKKIKSPWYNFYKYCPTTSALFRTLFTLCLSTVFFTTVYPPYPTILYFIYFVFIVTTYDRISYHKYSWRRVRILVDLALAIVIFTYYGGIKNPNWLLFLIPISTVARRYLSFKTIIITSISILSIILISTLPVFEAISNFYHLIRIENIQVVNIDELKNASNFNKYLEARDGFANWQAFKQLIIVSIFFIVVAVIFQAETKIRIKRIFDFTAELFDDLIDSKKTINYDIIRKLCREINSEALFVFEKNDENYLLSMGFQTHALEGNKQKILCDKQLLTKDDYTHIEDWFKEVQDLFKSKREGYDNLSLFTKWYREDNKYFLKHFEEEVNEIRLEDDEDLITKFVDYFFNNGIVASTRKRANLLQKKDIVVLVPIRINDSYIVFINNLPSKFKIVQRVFWEDGIQKVRMIKYLMSSVQEIKPTNPFNK
ncbi:MAG: hypothetical protein JST55_14000 [Bacteroidetes bacterium]|nr:hypothetical protein [Bacteroidota bacterium]